MQTYKDMYICIQTYAYIYIYIRVCVCIYIYIYIARSQLTEMIPWCCLSSHKMWPCSRCSSPQRNGVDVRNAFALCSEHCHWPNMGTDRVSTNPQSCPPGELAILCQHSWGCPSEKIRPKLDPSEPILATNSRSPIGATPGSSLQPLVIR